MSNARTWICPTKTKPVELTAKAVIVAFSCAFLMSCAESHSPNTEELITVQPPTINNTLNNGFLTTPTKDFVITGTCDVTGAGMQYQRDGGAWVDFSPGCVNGAWSLQQSLVKLLTISIRSKSKFRFTGTATVTARFVLPPTSPSMQLVASGQTMEENLQGIQAAVPGNGIVPTALSAGGFKIFPNVIGASYDK